MSDLGRRLMAALPAVFAVATLPLGILSLLFFGWQFGITVFVIGWLLLVPLTAVLSEEVFSIRTSDIDQGMETERASATVTEGARDDADDPLEILRDRYARGDLDDDEFERALETLVESEDADPAELLERRRREEGREREPEFES